MSSFSNPSEKWCWETCNACYRCANKGRYSHCENCSGRHDPFSRVDPHPDDFCDCKNGVLRWRAQDGKVFVRRYDRNPFKAKVIVENKTQDEKDWESYVQDMREKFDNPNWDPVKVYDFEKKDAFSDKFKTLDPKDYN